MMPAVAGEKSTKIQMLIYTILLLPIAVSPAIFGYASIGYGVTAFALSAFFIYTALRVLYNESNKMPKLMFGYSIFYLFAIFLGLMIYA